VIENDEWRWYSCPIIIFVYQSQAVKTPERLGVLFNSLVCVAEIKRKELLTILVRQKKITVAGGVHNLLDLWYSNHLMSKSHDLEMTSLHEINLIFIE
jgi:hypothetical protein